MLLDVYYNDFGISPESYTAAVVFIITSWDGSQYAETNVRDACGPNQFVYPGDRHTVAYVGNFPMNSPASFK